MCIRDRLGNYTDTHNYVHPNPNTCCTKTVLSPSWVPACCREPNIGGAMFHTIWAVFANSFPLTEALLPSFDINRQQT